jgi:hypothetical protein
MAKENSIPEFLRDLAERLMRIPVKYGTDQSDVDRLYHIARQFDEKQPCTTP